MIAKLVGSQDVSAIPITPIVDDFDFIQIVRTTMSDIPGDNIFISNGFSGDIYIDLPNDAFISD